MMSSEIHILVTGVGFLGSWFMSGEILIYLVDLMKKNIEIVIDWLSYEKNFEKSDN